ncbi:MAG TPA: ABC transporter substrate-binding protein [Arthrobacter sp.]|nr:ABC transporter substrate-binding protein [Arthrobacter sp.]
MPQPVDVGSILGGRYKVTNHVTTSADDDLVLDGVDQVLNRGVSILVAGSDNAEQVAASAREIATGERPGHVQVLDLGLADSRTYLITNQTSAADLLDLVVAANPPYVEPFYTDTLGTEIFGQPRSTEPEPYDDRYEPARYQDVQQGTPARTPEPGPRDAGARRQPVVPPPPSVPPKSAAQQPPTNQDTPAVAPTAAASGAQQDGNTSRSPQQHEPKVTLWDQDEYAWHDEQSNSTAPVAAGAAGGAAASAAAGRSTGGTGGTGPGRPASRFPAAARGSGAAYTRDEDEEYRKKPAFTRWLVGAVLAILLIVAVVLAVGQLGSMFQPTASDNPGSEQNAPENPAGPQAEDNSGASDQDESQSPSPSPSATQGQGGANPKAVDVTRLVPDSPDLDSGNDDLLPQTIDGNPATAWNSLLYANDTFGGFASNMALVVELEKPSKVTEVQLQQLNGAGGSFQILLNDSPSLEGAQQVAQGSFTAPSITLPIPEQEGEPRKAQYVIINFTELPQLANSNGPYPWGIKLAEINIS